MKLSPVKFILIILAAAAAAGLLFFVSNPNPSSELALEKAETPTNSIAGAEITEIKPEPALRMPISEGLTRITKKPFGLYVTPESSPVDNDVFTGFHTGIDFEIFPNEENIEVPIVAACDGKILLKQWAKGYGGVLVQGCELESEAVTVIYGHLDLASITAEVGDMLSSGDAIGNLGQGFSSETDGRREHLHFDIHKGTEINILGYVLDQEDLADWIDPLKFLQ